jgi:hypothetical protein
MMEQIRELIAEGKTVTLTVKGNSMNPFMVHLRDQITLGPWKDGDIRTGTVALVRDTNGNYLIHRIIRRDAGTVTLLGDGNLNMTETATFENIIGIMLSITRKGRIVRADSLCWKAYSWIWRIFTPVRRLPLGVWRKLNRKIQASTLFKMDVKWMNRAGYYGSASAGARIKWTFQKGENIIHEFTPVRLEYNHLLSTTQRFDSLMTENPALYESLRDKLVPSMEYAFTWTSPKVQKHQGRVSLFTKQAIQFQKYTAEYSHMLRVSPRSQLVVRGYLGFIWNYGDKTAPYADLFSAGGANSIRAFGVRGIGPGSYNPAESSYSYLDQVGNIRFECNMEYRFPIVANLFGAVFLDAGNVWLTKEDPARPGGRFQWKNFGKELALGTGAGLRYDLEFLVIRFDVGVGLHAPYDTGKTGYYNMPSFGKSLGYHFAVGYPF